MSVLIKGITFPENCARCPYRKITYDQNGFYWISVVCCARGRGHNEMMICQYNDEASMEYALRSGRPVWCPLTEVAEPHGRLIDADDFFQRLSEKSGALSFYHDRMLVDVSDLVELLGSLKTVIEAEGDS